MMLPLNLRYTLCFLTRGPEVLLLHRRRPPNQGKWNGIGGKIQPGEAPLAACLREAREETGYALTAARFAGLLTWTGFEVADGGLYLFTAEAPGGEPGHTPEGELRWWPKALATTSPEVVSNLHIVLPPLFRQAAPQVYHMRYGDDGRLVEHTIAPWPTTAAPGLT